MSRLKVVQDLGSEQQSVVENVPLNEAELACLQLLSRKLNPDMPLAFGGAHVIRALLERCEDAGLDADALMPGSKR